MTISMRLSEKDSVLIRQYAELKGLTVSEFMRRCAIEKIEDEFDLQAFEQAYAEYEADPTTFSLDEVEKELGLK